jgi:hypothetical protein
MNFVPKMDSMELLDGYKTIIQNIYSTKPYYRRIRQFLLNYRLPTVRNNKIALSSLNAFFKSILIIGIINKGRGEYWKFIMWTLIRRPGLFMDAMTFAVYGYHFRTVYGLNHKNTY